MLLSSLPNLRKLDINFGHYNGHADFVTVWSAIVRGTREPALVTNERTSSCLARATRSISSPGPLDVMVTGADDKYPHSPDHFAAFMHTPNLRSIYGWRTGDADIEPIPETDACAKLKPRYCPVEYIELRTSKLHSSNLRFLLDAAIPGKLKTFNYEIGCTWAWCRVEHPQIMTSMRPHHDTLETLGLSHEDFYPYEMGHESDVPSACSFTSFVALKRLKVAPVFVWGHEGLTSEYELDRPQTKEMLWKALPGNLEDLWITRAHQQDVQRYDARDRFVPDCLLPALDLVVQNKPEAFAKLAHLRIELPPLMWKEEWFDTLDSVCRLAASYGTTTTIILFDLCDRWSELAVEKAWGWNEDILWEPLRYSINRESAKVWVDEAAQTDLAQTLKDLKARFEGEMEKYEDVKRRRGAMGPLCRDCQYSPEYDPAAQVDMSELKRFVEDRLHSKSYWRGGLSVLCCEDI